MDANATSLASLLPDWRLTSEPQDLLQAARLLHVSQKTATTPNSNFILQTKDWLNAAENDPESACRLPHSWDVTSDSIAAWASIQLHATELVLLKSCDVPETSVTQLAELGIVDAHLPNLNHQLQKFRFVCQQLPRFSS